MISINNFTEKVKYNDLFELARSFFPDHEITEFRDFESNYVASLSYNENRFLAELTCNSGEPGISIVSDADSNIYRDEEATQRISAKKAFYDMLSTYTEKKLPWGILTGIRPIKVTTALKEKGISDKEIIDILTGAYSIDTEKAQLSLQICNTQEKIIKSFEKDTFSLYISIPFCPSRCLYCSFPSLPISKFGKYIEEYLDVLLYELIQIKDMMKGWRISTIYIGGGTPTTLPVEMMDRLLVELEIMFPGTIEITVEAGRPDTLNFEYLKLFKSHRIDRISINPQTMNDETLKLIGRKHTAKDVVTAYRQAKDIGIPIVNMDLIVGLPGERRGEIINTLDMIDNLDPDNLTVHTLSVKKGSNLMIEKETFKMTNDIEIESMLKYTREFAAIKGLTPYYLYRQKQILGSFENIGYSKKENPCVYNVAIMDEKQTIISAGMGAISKVYNTRDKTLERVPNFKDLDTYMKRTEELVKRKRALVNRLQAGW